MAEYYDPTCLPSDPDTWPLWRKADPARMIRMTGPFSVETQEGPVTCQDGYLALDKDGWPYPVKAEPDTGYPLGYAPESPVERPQVVVTAEMLELTSPAATEHRYVTDGVKMADLEAWAEALTARLNQSEG